ncbi:MAG: hypothetical protein RJA22_3061 [Verrucomicrobiota bacterium]
MCAGRVQKPTRWEYGELAILFFLHGMAMAMWFVPLSPVLEAHGLGSLRPLAYATAAVAAFVAPLLFGAMADRHAGPVRVLRWLALATAVAMALASTAIRQGWHPGVVLALVQLHALCSSPTWSLSSTIVLGRLTEARRQFGPLRATATLGWMSGCWVVSALGADTSTLAGYGGAVAWLVLAGFSFMLPAVAPPPVEGALTLGQRLGLDALVLLRHPDHRVVFITAALFSVPLAAFYPFTPPQLRDLGLEHTAAWMTLGQVTEILAMFGLAGLLTNWRLKTIIAVGLGFGFLRYALCALDGRGWVLSGVVLHGFAFTLFFITAQIYLDERVEAAWRARAQALMSLMSGGVGNLAGYLGTGAWFAACAREGGRNWSLFWGGLAVAVAAVLAYFLVAYRGRPAGART